MPSVHPTRRAALILAILAAVLAAASGAAAQSSLGATQTARTTHTEPTHLLSTACKAGYYKNVSRHCVRSPGKDPAGTSARCVDGSYSYSQHASGTCSDHGGVARWIRHP
jgi:hypothetical protein